MYYMAKYYDLSEEDREWIFDGGFGAYYKIKNKTMQEVKKMVEKNFPSYYFDSVKKISKEEYENYTGYNRFVFNKEKNKLIADYKKI